MKSPAILLASICVLLSGCGALPRREVSPELAKDSVLVHKLPLHKNELAIEEIGAVSDLFVDNQNHNLIVAGDRGAAVVGEASTIRLSATFPHPGTNSISIVPTGHTVQFLNRGSWGAPSCLFDDSGRTLWTAPRDPAVDDTAFGALGKPAKTMFVVGYNGGGGVSLLDSNGAKVWNKPDGNVWHVEVLEEKSAPAKIIHSNAQGEITVRDESGNTVSKTRAPFYFSNFALSDFPQPGDDKVIVASADGYIWLLKADGSVVRKFLAPINEQFASIKSVPVSFDRKKYQNCFASVVSWSLLKRSVLYVHDSAGELVYEETFSDTNPAVAVIPGQDGKPEILIVGALNKICKYRL